MTKYGAALVVSFAIACGPPKPAVTVPAPVATASDTPTADNALEPPQPTLRLPRNFAPTSYEARLAIDPKKPTFTGSIAITGTVGMRSRVIWLHGRHLTIQKAVARSGETEVPLVVTPKTESGEQDLLEVRADPPLEAGEWTLAFDYGGEVGSLDTAGIFRQTVGDASYVYTQFEALYARRAFPCVDEPDSKVPWKLTLDVPKDLMAVSNTPGTETPLDATTKRVEFEKTPPLPTYLVAFGVGPFEVVDAGKTKLGTPLRVITLAKRSADAAWAAKTAAPILDGLESWFGGRLPYPKLDLLSIPLTVGFGAMENAGLITFTEGLILHDPAKVSKEREHRWVVVCAHEMAHQWFGDLVTMKYWDDIWLNEGFANWMEAKVTNAIDPTYHDELSELEMRNGALGADALVSARQIRQPIETADDILTAFDGITYNKGASILNMFEHYIGAETFRQGVRDYLQSKAFGNATSKDFVAAIADADGGKHGDIASAFATFLDRPGAPEITATKSCTGKPRIELTQRRYVPPGAPSPPESGPWVIPVCVAFDNANPRVRSKPARGEACTLMSTTTATLDLPTKYCPRWVMPDVEGRSYYRSAYTVADAIALRDEAWPQLSSNERRAVYFDIKAAATAGKLPLQLALSFIPKLLIGDDRYTIASALSLPNGLDHLVPDSLRPKYEYWMRTQFGPGAQAAGFVAKDTDTLDVESIREDLVGAVAWHGRDPALIAEAVKLARNWRDLPQSIRGLVLSLAVDADAGMFSRVLKDVYSETDRTRRREMFSALGAARDPGRHQRALALVLDPKLDIRETSGILFSGATEANHAAGRAFFKAHDKAIIERYPHDGTASRVSGFTYLFTATCKADQRDAVVSYVTKTFAPLAGGPRTVKQAIEGMDQCIARRAVLEPEIRAWLEGLKIPRDHKRGKRGKRKRGKRGKRGKR